MSGPAKGMSQYGKSNHGPDCTCQRCRGWMPGNQAAVKHGAYAVVKLSPRVDELAAGLRDQVPVYSESDEIAVRLLGLTLARLEAAAVALESAEPGDLDRLDTKTRQWVSTAARLLNELGMTPTARARLGLDVVRAAVARENGLAQLAAQGRETQP